MNVEAWTSFAELGAKRSRTALALLAALSVHAALALLAVRLHHAGLPPHFGEVLLEISEIEPPAPAKPEPTDETEPKPERTEARLAPTSVDHARPASPAAEAAPVLTQTTSENAPLDLTGADFASGEGANFAGGITRARGSSKSPGRNTSAAEEKGDRQVLGAPTPPGPDRSRAATPIGGSDWSSCGFPSQVGAAGIDYAVAVVVVTVAPNGKASSVSVVNDPGNGFGDLARRCAYGMRYQPGLDSDGQAIAKATPPIRVRFTR